MSEDLKGGCHCKKIRYVVSGAPVLQLFCYCADCRSLTGADGWASYMVSDSDFSLTNGEASSYTRISEEGRSVVINFCSDCGSNLYANTELGITSVAAGSLDTPEAFNPVNKVYADQAPHWARIPEYLAEM